MSALLLLSLRGAVVSPQMTGGSERLVIGECDPDTMRPSLAWLERELAGPSPPKMVVLVNPCNPTGEYG